MIIPTKKQALLLACPANEILFGGARGGGKTFGLVLDFVSNYSKLGGAARGIFFRRTYKELEGCYDTFNVILTPLGFSFHWSKLSYINPSGAIFKLGYMLNEQDADNYQGHQYSWIGFDEIGNLTNLKGIEKLKATLRGFPTKQRIVFSANPGGRAHKEIKDKFPIENPYKIITDNSGWSKCYIPSVFDDNEYLKKLDPHYIDKATKNLPEYLKRAWAYGDWNISFSAGMFFRETDFIITDTIPKLKKIVRAWDRAATEPSSNNPDPDYTAGVKLGLGYDNFYYVLDVIRLRARAAIVEKTILRTACDDGVQTEIVLLQDPGQAGKEQIDNMLKMLAGYIVIATKETGQKHTRWLSLSSAAQNGLIRLYNASWNYEFISELVQLTNNESDYAHDDQIDAAAAAFKHLTATSSLDFVVF